MPGHLSGKVMKWGEYIREYGKDEDISLVHPVTVLV
jgi:hypothetical protein